MNESRDYKSSNRNRRMPRRMRERESSKKRREIYLLIACLLLAMNVLLLLRTQAQIKGLNKALSQVLNRLAVNVQEEDLGDPRAEASGDVRNPGYYSAGEPAAEPEKEEFVDYVSMCGLPQVDKPVKRTNREVLDRLEELAEDSELIDEIFQGHEQYSDDMLKALANNPEMADFVRNSLEAKAKVNNAKLSVLEKGQEFPLFLQWDPRWGYAEYGENNIGLSGCGPTCVSMALYYLLGDESITPDKVAEYSMENGYYVMGTGTAWALLEAMPAEYGIKVTQPSKTEQNMKNELDAGGVIICSMKAGDFTDGGHFVVIYGYDEDGFLINDSNCVARSRQKWPYSALKKQLKNIWVYHKAQNGNSGSSGRTYDYVTEADA
ncbi:MAG: C39 family peptidase [Lachnospiraceae bacterium]|uniref:C39 family peptidase n=1 Tax=uncultured Acetatifactor sp. TaxID=1671927 RepID=UPI00262B7AD3|nr:C39 family peptidase [uncultured Acetatifactor sp.]MCI8789076.1 C39 family peptidase [Lachnospiraceae bacterium]